ncbi:MAG: hypothetical protein RIE06_33790 [Roseibium album]|uniref:hypothetical protein n=1 Tax=Roseibium album TaxID=311410 RepID=UPI0032EF6DEB
MPTSMDPISRDSERLQMHGGNEFARLQKSAPTGVGAGFGAFTPGSNALTPLAKIVASSETFLPAATSLTPVEVGAALARFEAAAKELMRETNSPSKRHNSFDGQFRQGGEGTVSQDGSVFIGGGTVRDASRILARLMVELAGLNRQEALEARLAARFQTKAEMLNQAAEQRESASKTKSAAMTAMWVSVAFGAVSIAGAGFSLVGAGKNTSDMRGLNKKLGGNVDDVAASPQTQVATVATAGAAGGGAPGSSTAVRTVANEADVDLPVAQPLKVKDGPETPASRASANGSGGAGGDGDLNGRMIDLRARAIDSESQKYYAMSTLAASFGSMGGGVAQAAASDDTESAKLADADGSAEAAQAEETKSEGDVSREVQQALTEFYQAIISFIKEIRTAEVERARAITGA